MEIAVEEDVLMRGDEEAVALLEDVVLGAENFLPGLVV